MKPLLILSLLAAIAGSVIFACISGRSANPQGIEVGRLSSDHSLIRHDQQPSAGLCPWRNPEADRRRFFPASTSSRDETLILSRHRLELQRRLGHAPTGDESAIIVHRILAQQGSPGVVVTRRVRGENGLIELVLAVDAKGRVTGAKVQRHREPEATARALQSESWLGAMDGKDSCSAWSLGQDIPDVPAEARLSAEAIVKEAKTVLILLDVALHSDSALPH